MIDIVQRTVAAYTAPEQPKVFRESDVIAAPGVLPGFTLPLRELFAELDRAAS
jgi:hypothetical protein